MGQSPAFFSSAGAIGLIKFNLSCACLGGGKFIRWNAGFSKASSYPSGHEFERLLA